MSRFEEIHYDLSYHGDDPEIERYLVEVIARLPDDVATYALEHCSFLSTGRATATLTLPGSVAKYHRLFGLEIAMKIAREQGDQKQLRSYQRAVHRLASVETWLVLFNERIADEGEDEAMGIIAHEIAHAWLKHNRYDPALPPECEIEAAHLAQAWGFKGRGTDAGFCYRPLKDEKAEQKIPAE